MKQNPSDPSSAGDAATRRSIAGGAGITLAGAVIGGVLVLLNEIIAARFLGVTAYGFYALAYAFTRIGEVVSLFGLRVALLHFLPLNWHANRLNRVAGVIYAAIALPAAIACSLALLLWLGADTMTERLFDKPGAGLFLRVLAFAVPLMALSEIIGHVARGFGHTFPYVISRNFVPPILFFLLLITISTLGSPPQWVAISFLISQFFGLLVACYTLMRVVDKRIWRTRAEFQIGSLYRYAFPVFLNTILYLVIAWTDLLLIGYFATADDLGIYRGCMQFALVFEMMGLAFNAATAHIYPVMLAENQHDRLQPLYATIVRWIAMLAFCAFLLIVTNAPDLLSLLGADFVRGASALALLAGAGLVRSLGSSAGFMLVVGKRQTTETANVVVAAILNVILNLILIPQIGILGAAVATCITMTLVSGLRIAQVRRVFKINTPFAPAIRIGLPMVIAGLALAGLAEFSGLGNGHGLAMLLLRLALSGIALAALTWFVLAHKQDRELVGSLMKRRRAVES